MATTALSASVRCPDGRVTTIAELAKEGKIEFSKVDNFIGLRGARRTVYFADIKGTQCGWEISRTAYLSRTGQKEQIREQFAG